MYLLQLSKMKRIDFRYGVVSLTIFLFLPIFFQVYGFFDVQKYRSVTSDNSFYEKLIRTYPCLYVLQNTFVLYFHIFDCSISWSDICFVKRKGFDKVSDSMLPSLFSLSLYGVSYSIRSKIRQYQRLYT